MSFGNTSRKLRLFSGVSALAISLVLVLVSPAHPLDSRDEISRIQKSYEGVRDMEGNFVQKNHIKDLGRTDTYEGVFFIKRPSMMRWSYRGDKWQEIIINGDTVLIYKSAGQTFVGSFNRESYGQAPVALLNGFGKIGEEFDATVEDSALVLTPKNRIGNIKSITLVTSRDGFPLKSFRIEDEYSNTVEITLKDVRLNTGVPESVFDIKNHKGAESDEHNP